MTAEFYSIEQVAQQLGLHVRTVRGYVRSGRLRATRIGKQYRIAASDLDAFMGPQNAHGSLPLRRTRHVDVSSIVQIDAASPEFAQRVTTGLMGAANARTDRAAPLRVETQYDESIGRLKVIATGDLATVTSLLGMLRLYLE
jgi:excisionase family DNA binding protein